jgi:hypothetical protein
MHVRGLIQADHSLRASVLCTYVIAGSGSQYASTSHHQGSEAKHETTKNEFVA